VDHHRRQPLFATASVQVDLWDPQRAEPVHSFGWGAETIRHVKFNLVETNVLVSTASDRNICLYDCRTKTPIKKIIMKVRALILVLLCCACVCALSAWWWLALLTL
jgi:WD repeat and SOF domain-containing protein 1